MNPGPGPWRSLQSVMLVTVHVAVIAFVLRTFLRPAGSAEAFAIWVPLTIALAVFLSWPIARGLARISEVDDPTCPDCGRGALRPLVRHRPGLFHETSGFRCAVCKTTFRHVGDSVISERAWTHDGTVEAAGIEFLGPDPTGEDIRFLDDRTEEVAGPS